MKTNIIALMGAAAALALVSAAPAAHAQNNYDGYCYAKKKANSNTGTIVGAIIGGAIGSQVSKHERGLGTVGGAVVGGAIGHQVGKDSTTCMNGAYYSYQSGYYTPPPAPDGYQVVYYNSRPDGSYYKQVYTTRPYAYNNDNSNSDVQPGAVGGNSYSYDYRGAGAREGWRDTDGNWHLGKPAAYGWRDSNGDWHQGQVQSYGWRDSQGYWHDDKDSNSDNGY